MNTTPDLVIDDFIVEKLLASSVITGAVGDRIWSEGAPADTEWPFILIAHGTLDGWLALGGEPVDASGEVTVKYVARADDWLPLRAVAGAIYTQLHKASGAPSGGGSVVECVWQRPFRLGPVIGSGSPEERHLGHVFSMTAS